MPDESDQGPRAAGLDARQLQRRALHGASWTMVHTVTSVPIAFVVNLLLARRLGVTDYGRLAFLMTLMDVVSGIVALGVTTGTVQFGARDHASGRASSVRKLLSQAQGFRLFIAAPLLTAVVLLAVQDVPWQLLLVAIVFGIWVPGLFDGALTALAIENKTAQQAKNAMLATFVMQVSVVLVLFTVGTADAVWVTRLAAGALSVGLALRAIDPMYRSAVFRPRLPTRMPSGFWRFAVPSAVGTLIATLVLSRTEVFVLQGLGDAEQVGVFALAFGLAVHVFAPAQALVGPLIPAVAALREVHATLMVDGFRRATRLASVVVAALSVTGLPLLAILLPLLYGAEYSAASSMLLVLGASAALLVLGSPVTAFVMARLAASTLLRVNLAALIVDVVLAFALIPAMGAWGAVIANCSGSMVRLSLLLRSELRHLGLQWTAFARDSASLAVALVVAAIVWALLREASLMTGVAAVLAGLLGLTGWVLVSALCRIGMTAADRQMLERALPRRLRPFSRGLALLSRQ